MVDQYRPHVEHYVKQEENRWLFTLYTGLKSHFTLSSLSVEIDLGELYEGIEF